MATTQIYPYCHTLSRHDALPIAHQDGARTPALAEQRCRFLGLPGTGRRAIAQKDSVGDKGAPRMVDADQRIVQDAPQRLDGTEVRVLAPGQIGDMTGGEPQPPLLLVVVVEQRIAPGHQPSAQAAEARLALGAL